ncbi:MAG: DUF1302 family protein [Candidatus Electrothrix scaldis]|nr:MAG: DUF1302 family protein [Candidatus Electrothrix sp. GW3-3]
MQDIKKDLLSRKATILAALLAAPLFLSPLPATAQTDSTPSDLDAVLEGFDIEQPPEEPASDQGLDAVLGGFEEEGLSSDLQTEAEGDSAWLPGWLSIDGWLQFGTTYTIAHDAPAEGETDWRGFSKTRTDLQIDLEARFSDAWSAKVGGKAFYDGIYSLRGRDEYTSYVLDEYEDEVELREAYLQGKLTDKLDLKIGRQIVVWGKSDNIRITDVLNPLDMREPGLTDIEDLRLPLAMTKLDYYFGNWELSGIAVHEIRFNKLPVYGYDFYSYDEPLPPEDEPANTLENTEWAISLSGIFTGWDLDLYYARIFNDTPHLEYVVIDEENESTEIQRKHERMHMFGFAYNKALGNWLVKTEGALLNRVHYTNRPGVGYTRIDALVGVEYSGFNETSLSLELANHHINNHRPYLEDAPDGVYQDMYQLAFRCTRDFLNDTLSVTLLAMLYGPSSADGAYERLSFDYDVTDTITLRGGAVLYQSGDLLALQDVGDNDRIFAEIRYSF